MVGHRQAVEQAGLAVVDEFHDELSEDGVGPSHPAAGKAFGIVLVERLVDEAEACIGVHDLGKTAGYLIVVVGGIGFDDDAQ